MRATKPELDPEGRYSYMETARLLGLHPSTIKRYVSEGKLTAHRWTINNAPYILGEDILNAWEETKTE